MTHDHEQWRAVAGYEGAYEVSSHGRVRSLSRQVLTRQGRRIPVPGRIRKSNGITHGQLQLFLCHPPGTAKGHLVHALVAQAFLGPRPEGHVVVHVDGDPTNNRPENLKWVLRREVSRHCCPRGEQCPRAKLTEAQVKEMCRRACRGETARSLALAYGVSHKTVQGIVRGRSWKHLAGEMPPPPPRMATSHRKLTEDQVRTIRRRAAEGVTGKAIAEEFGLHESAVSLIVRHRRWSHVPAEPDVRRPDRPKTKLTEAQVREIQQPAAAGMPRVRLAAHFGVTATAVSWIIHRRSWRNLEEPPASDRENRRGQAGGRAKPPADQIRQIRAAWDSGVSVAEIAMRFNLAAKTVCALLSGHFSPSPSRDHSNRCRRGAAHPRAKLTEDGVRQIRALWPKGHPRGAIAEQFGVTAANVMAIVSRHTWKHIE